MTTMLTLLALATGGLATVTILLIVAAFVCTILAAMGKCPAWIPLLLVVVLIALMVLPK